MISNNITNLLAKTNPIMTVRCVFIAFVVTAIAAILITLIITCYKLISQWQKSNQEIIKNQSAQILTNNFKPTLPEEVIVKVNIDMAVTKSNCDNVPQDESNTPQVSNNTSPEGEAGQNVVAEEDTNESEKNDNQNDNEDNNGTVD